MVTRANILRPQKGENGCEFRDRTGVQAGCQSTYDGPRYVVVAVVHWLDWR